MSLIDNILKETGLKYEELNTTEKETLNVWMEALEKGAVTIPKVKEYVSTMKDAVERELSVAKLNKKKDLFLKARLRNYLLLDAFLSTPEKAKQQLEAALAGVARKIK